MNELVQNIEHIHTTKLGLIRIKRNLKLEDNIDVIEYCKELIKNSTCKIKEIGKNYYVEIEDIKITINKYSYTIITAHKLPKSSNNS